MVCLEVLYLLHYSIYSIIPLCYKVMEVMNALEEDNYDNDKNKV